jgi:CheY-like chemotaxis protein
MINQKVLLRQLRKAGMECEAANNGQEAVNRLRKVHATQGAIDKPFDVVLMDVSMPGGCLYLCGWTRSLITSVSSIVMDGLTAIRIIRDEEQAGKLRRSWVFALTGNARQAQVDDALAHGMDAVIIKPYTLDSLIERIHGVCDIS